MMKAAGCMFSRNLSIDTKQIWLFSIERVANPSLKCDQRKNTNIAIITHDSSLTRSASSRRRGGDGFD